MIRYSNASWTKAYLVDEREMAYFTNLIGRIQSIEGYSEDLKIAYIGRYDKSLETVELTSDLRLYSGQDTNINDYSSNIYLQQFCGFNQETLDDSESNDLYRNSKEIQSMPNYPNDGSIKIIDGVIVVKFADVE